MGSENPCVIEKVRKISHFAPHHDRKAVGAGSPTIFGENQPYDKPAPAGIL
jgi:hypothetical protein